MTKYLKLPFASVKVGDTLGLEGHDSPIAVAHIVDGNQVIYKSIGAGVYGKLFIDSGSSYRVFEEVRAAVTYANVFPDGTLGSSRPTTPRRNSLWGAEGQHASRIGVLKVTVLDGIASAEFIPEEAL